MSKISIFSVNYWLSVKKKVVNEGLIFDTASLILQRKQQNLPPTHTHTHMHTHTHSAGLRRLSYKVIRISFSTEVKLINIHTFIFKWRQNR